MGYYIIQVYIPCVFLVMLSWVVFWMRPDDSASRLTVGITTILTIVFLLGYTNGMLPKVILSFEWLVTDQALFDVMRRSSKRAIGYYVGEKCSRGNWKQEQFYFASTLTF